ncbi:hypothetical protein OUZ56_021250 [Daphnia magna]|uniref:Uncharacterized protein n=1 Tax=Daphnia magna TaxID=35525 RepID=A0ABQ9ZGV0_9CRUS|nr:hypothetical protein OUZ56_021250 [Daphnia magna]
MRSTYRIEMAGCRQYWRRSGNEPQLQTDWDTNLFLLSFDLLLQSHWHGIAQAAHLSSLACQGWWTSILALPK